MSDDWIRFTEEEYKYFKKHSAVETLAVHHPMESETLETPHGVFRALKFGTVFGLNHEDMSNPEAIGFILQQIQADWAKTSGQFLDNLCLAADRFGPEQRVYEGSVVQPNAYVVPLIKQVQSRFHVRAEDDVLGLLEGLTTYAKKPHALHEHRDAHQLDHRPGIIAHPAFRKVLFGDNRPEGIPLVNDVPVKWSLGCRRSEEATAEPDGNPLLFLGNMNALKLGIRSGPEATISDMDVHGAGLKIRARRAFLVEPGNQFHAIELVN
jgi:hypothetical protein